MASLSSFWTEYKASSPMLDIPVKTQTGIGMLPAVISPANQAGFVPDFTAQNGKVKTAKYKFLQRQLGSTIKHSATDGSPNYCAATDVPVYREGEQDITRDTYKQFIIKNDDVRGYEESFRKVLEDMLMASANAFLTDMNADLIALYEAARGYNASGNTNAVSAQGFSSGATYTINQAFEHAIHNQFRFQQYRGQKIIVGDTLVNSFFRQLLRGGLNSERGQMMDNNLMRNFLFFDDTQLDSEIAVSNSSLVWRPGSFQLLEWYRNVGDFKKIKDNQIKDTMDLKLGDVTMRVDVTMTENFCTDETSGLIVTIRKEWDTWNFPVDIFNAADPLYQTNGMLRFTMTAA